uniref:C3H1-type domain-containing protein n=1 Tax=Caenorhabditis tropicalis TaxID=1561998 RepID=A0A1I7T5V2_9PELO
MAAHPRPIGEQMAAFNTSDDTSFAADQSNGLLNATCPARIQNTADLKNKSSHNESTFSSSGGKWQRPKREAMKITPLAQIDEVSPSNRHNARERNSDYKTKICIAFRREGHCPYNNKCTYAHGDNELRMPRRRPIDYGREHRDSRENREHRDNYDSRDSRDRRDSRSRRNNDDSSISFSRSSRYRDDNKRYPSSSSSRSSYRSVCHAFQRGHCPYGPRCRYLHVEQMAQFNGNATMFVPSSEAHMAYVDQQGQSYVPVMPYFIAPPQQHYPTNTPPPQFVTPCDPNQSIPIFAPSVMGNYYYQPMAPTPVMDQSAVGPEAFAEGFFVQPPAAPQPLMS